jgi:acyl-CoA-binding protein
LYKQTTIGDNNIPKPESSDIIETSKWLKWI